MDYLLLFLEGIITFISPCLLPMLPIYVSYFAGGGEKSTRKTLINVLGFVLGFTVAFVLMGLVSSKLGSLLYQHQTALNIVTGLVVVFFGLNYLGVFRLNIFRGMGGTMQDKELGFFSSLAFGLVFSVGWTPCVGPFLGSALLVAAQQGTALKGVFLLLTYSAGLGIPFVISALLIDKMKGAFDFIKRHYRTVNLISGILLVAMGLVMMFGLMNRLVALLS